MDITRRSLSAAALGLTGTAMFLGRGQAVSEAGDPSILDCSWVIPAAKRIGQVGA